VEIKIMALNKILIGVDGSKHNELVLDKAVEFANNNKTQIILVHAISPHTLSEQELSYAQDRCGEEFSRRLLGNGLPPYPIEENNERRAVFQYMETRETFNRVYAEDVLSRAKSYLDKQGINNIKAVIENSNPATAILEVADRENVDMIIIGRHGHNMLIDFFLGSTAQKVLQQSKHTVLTVK